jgi:hypothetical protein
VQAARLPTPRLRCDQTVSQVVPHQHDRTAGLLVRGIQQASEVEFLEPLRLAFASVIGQHAEDQAGSLPGLETDQGGQADPS